MITKITEDSWRRLSQFNSFWASLAYGYALASFLGFSCLKVCFGHVPQGSLALNSLIIEFENEERTAEKNFHQSQPELQMRELLEILKDDLMQRTCQRVDDGEAMKLRGNLKSQDAEIA